MNKQSKNILIIKIGAIGDVIMSLPIIHSIKEKYPNSNIYWVVGNGALPLIKNINGLAGIVHINDQKIFDKNPLIKILEIIKVWIRITRINKKFDLIINYQSDPLYKLVYWGNFFNSNYLSFNRYKKIPICPVPGRHHTYEYLRLVENKIIHYPFKIEFPELPFSTPTVLIDKTKLNGKVVFLGVGGAKNNLKDDWLRRWPVGNYVELTKLLYDLGHSVFLLGDKNDAWLEGYFDQSYCTSMIGKHSLLETIKIIDQADLVITHDCGILHFTNFSNVKTVGLFGSTNPYEKVPLNSNSYFIWGGEKLACRPCYDGRYYGACPKNICMEEITPKQVINFLFQHGLLTEK